MAFDFPGASWYPTQLSLERLLSRSSLEWWAVREAKVVGFARTLIGVAGLGTAPDGLGEALAVMDGRGQAPARTGVLDLCFHGMYRGEFSPGHQRSLLDLSKEEQRYLLSLMLQRSLACQSLQNAYDQVVEARDLCGAGRLPPRSLGISTPPRRMPTARC